MENKKEKKKKWNKNKIVLPFVNVISLNLAYMHVARIIAWFTAWMEMFLNRLIHIQDSIERTYHTYLYILYVLYWNW